MAAVTEDTYICPQCARELQLAYYDIPDIAADENKEKVVFVNNKTSVNMLMESWVKAALSAINRTEESGSNWEANFDEYISLAAGMSVRLAQGDFDRDARKCFEAMWQFHAENKFKQYIGAIAECGDDLSYEELCEILVLPRPDLEQIMELVNFITANNK
jgi:hypothetical protein